MAETIREHHKQGELVYGRPEYREARWERAVKVGEQSPVTKFRVLRESIYRERVSGHADPTHPLLKIFDGNRLCCRSIYCLYNIQFPAK